MPAGVGVFDSGIGGLTVWREIARLLPSRDLVYYGDQAHCPYGSRSTAEIQDLAHRAAAFLVSRGARVIVVACNTASTAALEFLRRAFPDVLFVGMEPAIKPAAGLSHTRKIGLLATRATLHGDAWRRVRERYAQDVEVIARTPEGLVDRIEAGDIDSPETRAIVRAAVEPLRVAGVDVIVLGCTHYPFSAPLIQEIAGEGIALVDPSLAVAQQVARVVTVGGDRSDDNSVVNHRFYTSGDPVRMARVMEKLLKTRNLVLSDSMV